MFDFLGAKAPLKMIELFCKNPEKEFYSKEIGDKLELSKATNIKWLKNLTERGIISERSHGRKKIYKLRLGNPIVRQLRVLHTLSKLIPVLGELNELKSAYLVGESSKGTASPDAPIELLILKRGDDLEIRRALEDVSDRIGRKIEAKIMTPLEYAELARDNPKLHERLEREKIRLAIS